jgi:hypothetical protein
LCRHWLSHPRRGGFLALESPRSGWVTGRKAILLHSVMQAQVQLWEHLQEHLIERTNERARGIVLPSRPAQMH